jgi:hypothetical protein
MATLRREALEGIAGLKPWHLVTLTSIPPIDSTGASDAKFWASTGNIGRPAKIMPIPPSAASLTCRQMPCNLHRTISAVSRREALQKVAPPKYGLTEP